jgi:hypothetical protein
MNIAQLFFQDRFTRPILAKFSPLLSQAEIRKKNIRPSAGLSFPANGIFCTQATQIKKTGRYKE